MENLKGVSNSTIENLLRDSMKARLRLATATRHKRIDMNLRISKAKSEGASGLDIQRMEVIADLHDRHFRELNEEYLAAKEKYEKHIGKLSVRAQKRMNKLVHNIKLRLHIGKKPDTTEQDARELLTKTNRVVVATVGNVTAVKVDTVLAAVDEVRDAADKLLASTQKLVSDAPLDTSAL